MDKPESHASGHGHEEHVGHVVPTGLLVGVLLALLVLTWVTVAVRYIDLGELNIWIAMGIATIKAALVALYFMHLRWDKPFNAIVLVGSLIFVGLFLIASLTDTTQTENIVDFSQSEEIRGAQE